MKTLAVLRFIAATLCVAGAIGAAPILAQQIQVGGSAHLPIITSQPLSQVVREGTRVTFSVTATGSGELTYRWYRGTQAIDNGNSPVLTLAAAKVQDNGAYHVEVSNVAGATTSSIANLTVSAQPPPVASAPTITLQPTSLVVNNGGTAIFSVTANGQAVLEYQWMKNDLPIGGATSPTLALTGVKITDAATYTVRVSNSAGTITSTPATLTVNISVSLVMDLQQARMMR